MEIERGVRGIISTLAGAIAWGISGTCVQYLFAHSKIDSLLLTSLRELGAGAMFLVLLLATRKEQVRDMLSNKDTRLRLLVFGIAGLFLNSALYATTISYTNAGTATVLQTLAVPMVLGFTCMLEQRAPRPLELAALVCAALATFFIATGGDITALHLPLAGLFFGVATATAAVFYTSFPKTLFMKWGSLATTGLGMAVAGVGGIVFWFFTRGIHAGFPVLSWDCWVVLGIAVALGTFGAYGLYLHGISIVGPVQGNMLGAAEPVSATVFTSLLLGTSFSWADWLGLVLMVATILLVGLQSKESAEHLA